MAAPGKSPTASSSSRWGSFLSQAVNSVESRLDTMLGEHEEGEAGSTQGQAAPARPATPSKPAQQRGMDAPSSADSRSSSTSRANDRLQARLARAMAGKNAPGASSPRSSAERAGRTSADQPATEREPEPREDERSDDAAALAGIGPSTFSTASTAEAVQGGKRKQLSEADPAQRQPSPVSAASEGGPTYDAQPEQPHAAGQAEREGAQPQASVDGIGQVPPDAEGAKTKEQEDLQDHIERIDSLQAKIQYLSRNAAEAAKANASSAPSGSVERRLADKDEKIALLMAEGTKLSSTEHKLRMTIKRLRAQASDTEKQLDELRKANAKAVADMGALRDRLDGNEQSQKRQEEVRRMTASLQRDLDALKRDRADKAETIRRLEQQMKTKTEQAEVARLTAVDKALAAERQKQKELEEAIAVLRSENNSLSQKFGQEQLEWKDKHERAVQRGQSVEEELKAELRAAESKLEAMRSAAEEATSSSGGEAQVKLMRQVETLQSQYATASDNWRGIETSLLAKAAGLEKERDEAQRRESEMRRKARDVTSRNKGLEDELEDTRARYAVTKQELEACREQLAGLRVSLKTSEAALEQARAELESLDKSAPREEAAETERGRWVEGLPGQAWKGHSPLRPESPLLSVSRTASSDLVAGSTQARSRRAGTPGSTPDALEGWGSLQGRRPSIQPLGRAGGSPPVSGSPLASPFAPFEPVGESTGALSIATERDEAAGDVLSSSPKNAPHDMMSASTVAAGPSVQLVERMSAAIRRLEAEKVAAKEERARVCHQRDEARSDMLSLMRELETARSSVQRVAALEEEVSGLNSRYQTTLEMLGEKSERVEELQADVDDIKAMYRDLVERSVD